MNVYLFPALLVIALALSNYLIYSFLKRNLVTCNLTKFVKITLIFIAILQILYAINLRLKFLPNFISDLGAFCIGAGFFLFSTLLIYELIKIPFSRIKPIEGRRKTIKFIFDFSVIILAFSGLLKGFLNATSRVFTTSYKLNLEKLKSPMSFAIVSDLHIGKFLGKDYLEKIVKKVNDLEVDAVFLVGDLSDLTGEEISHNLAPLNDLKSKFGSFLVLGNHEYYHDLKGVVKEMSKLNLKILHNENLQVGGINLAGVYDLAGFKFGEFVPDFDKALSNLDENLPTILLSHQPKSTKYIKKEIDLVISGHTHAGQIFPFGLLAQLEQKYLYGLYDISQKMKILVTSGAGFWGPPIRILTKSEIVFLQILPKD